MKESIRRKMAKSRPSIDRSRRRIGNSTRHPEVSATLAAAVNRRVPFAWNASLFAEKPLELHPKLVPDERRLALFCTCPQLACDALIELDLRCEMGGLNPLLSVLRLLPRRSHLPQRRTACRCDARRRGRLAEMAENLANHRAVVDEGDDSHLTAALRADQRQHFMDARQEQRPDIGRGSRVTSSFAGASAVTAARSGTFCASRAVRQSRCRLRRVGASWFPGLSAQAA